MEVVFLPFYSIFFFSSWVEVEGIPFQQYNVKQVGAQWGHWPQISPTLRSEPGRKNWREKFSQDQITWLSDQRLEVTEKRWYSHCGNGGKNYKRRNLIHSFISMICVYFWSDKLLRNGEIFIHPFLLLIPLKTVVKKNTSLCDITKGTCTWEVRYYRPT